MEVLSARNWTRFAPCEHTHMLQVLHNAWLIEALYPEVAKGAAAPTFSLSVRVPVIRPHQSDIDVTSKQYAIKMIDWKTP